MVPTSGTRGEYSCRIAARDRRDGRNGPNEMGIQSAHGAPFSHVSRFTRHGLWRLRFFFSILHDQVSLHEASLISSRASVKLPAIWIFKLSNFDQTAFRLVG
jgi:hypothetical protein